MAQVALTDLAFAEARSKERAKAEEALAQAKAREAEGLREGALISKRIGSATYIGTPERLAQLERKHTEELGRKEAERKAREQRQTAPLREHTQTKKEITLERTERLIAYMRERGIRLRGACEALGYSYPSICVVTFKAKGYTSLKEFEQDVLGQVLPVSLRGLR